MRHERPPRLPVPFLVLACVLASESAEGFTLASASYELVPTADLKLSGAEDDELKTRATTATVKLAVPVLLSGRDSVLLNFFTVRRLHQSYEDAPSGVDTFRPDDLYTFKYGLVFRQVLSERWSLATLIQPALLTDLENVDSDHLSLRAGFVFQKKVSETLEYGFGAGYSDDFGGRLVLPVIRLDWRLGPSWSFELDAPQSLQLWRHVGSASRAGLVAKVTGGAFRIGERAALADGRTVTGGFVKYSILNVGPELEVPLLGGTHLGVSGGTSLFRRYEVVDGDDETLLDSRFESSFFVRTTLRYAVGGGGD